MAVSKPAPFSSFSQTTTHHLTLPPGISHDEFHDLIPSITQLHTYSDGPGKCSSLLAKRISAPHDLVWSIVRRFDKPQAYKHFIRSCAVEQGSQMVVGCTHDERRVTGFSIIGGEHRLRNYRSVTTVHGFNRNGKIWTVVLESYVVDVPEGNTEEDTRLFADTVVKLNLQKLASVTEGLARDDDNDGNNS
ncbi:hypothetical protein ES288_D12G248500v1 [Gossypium darwinii]|uniref:Uncharacterized protein n=1 Tax=Gossypium darwinii TaxID=34276 RepID=A0A5D2AD93_GOSDA|nr:hypothetical protein ES288_D12G248500v1 [Gossypium darwinii]